MKKPAFLFLTAVAIALIPLCLHFALNRYDGKLSESFAFWAPIGLLTLDAALFYVAFSFTSAKFMERIGLALILPLIVTMIAWAFMRGDVEAQMRAAQAQHAQTQTPLATPSATAPDRTHMLTGNDRDEHGCIGSAGYAWCEKENACVRPWEHTAAKGLPNTERAFNAYCAP